MALWAGLPGRGAGGTAHFVQFWLKSLVTLQLSFRFLKLSLARQHVTVKSNPERCEKPTMHSEVKTILFADIVGYSKLSEGVIPEFVKAFLSRLSRLIAEYPYSPVYVNMWGDEIYGVFDHARDGGLFALQLSKFLRDQANDC